MVVARLVVAVLLKTWSLLPDRYYIDNGDTIGYPPSSKLASGRFFSRAPNRIFPIFSLDTAQESL